MDRSRLSFHGEWYQEEASMVRPMLISYFPLDEELEVYDKWCKRLFLHRTKMRKLSVRDFFIGAKIYVFGRLLEIVDYADEATKNELAKYRIRTFFLIKHVIREHLGLLVRMLTSCNYTIIRAKMARFSLNLAKEFLEKKTHVMTGAVTIQLMSGPSIGFELMGENVLEAIRACRDATKDCNAKNVPEILANVLSDENITAGIYSSENEAEAVEDMEFFFNRKHGLWPTLSLSNSTLAIIKPHCIKEGHMGDVITEIINNGFKITGLRMTLVHRINSEEFFSAYRGVLPEYIEMVLQLSSGLCLALEVVCNDKEKNSAEEFRKFCGPMDPDLARLLRPNSLRAKFGKNKILNAVHCTDLKEDTNLEIQYLFNVLD